MPNETGSISNRPSLLAVASESPQGRSTLGVAVWDFAPTPPISTYLTTIVAGEYHVVRDSHTSASGQVIPLALACRASFTPYLDVAFETFGPDRLMIGSDWPVCLVAASYTSAVDVVRNYLSRFEPAVRDAVLGGNAQRFWRLVAH